METSFNHFPLLCVVVHLYITSVEQAITFFLMLLQITHCDTILEHMEGLLGKFQSDLGQVSEEIRTLQVSKSYYCSVTHTCSSIIHHQHVCFCL